MNVFSLINNYGLIIKVFKDVSKPTPSIDAMMISYGFFIRELVNQSLKPTGFKPAI